MTNQEWAKHLLRMNLDLSGLYHSVIYVLLTKASMTFKIRYQLSGITFTCIIINNNLILGTSPSLNTQSCIKRLFVVRDSAFGAGGTVRTVMRISKTVTFVHRPKTKRDAWVKCCIFTLHFRATNKRYGFRNILVCQPSLLIKLKLLKKSKVADLDHLLL